MKVKNLRLLMLITGDLNEETLKKIDAVPTNIATDILGFILDGQVTVEIVGTEARMVTCESCGSIFDLDDGEEEEDVTCSECGIGPLCTDCLESHICEESPIGD